MLSMTKRLVRDQLAARGYQVRWVGLRSSVTGVDFWHDVRVLLRDPAGAQFIDVGANVGQSIEAIRIEFTEPRIISFEPGPETFRRLKTLHGQTAGVQLEQAALGDRDGTIPFHLTARTDSHDTSVSDSILASTEYATGEVIDVPIWTLDDYCARRAITKIDMLKIDAEGYDLHVLRGAGRMLREQRVTCFSVEVLGSSLYEGQPEFLDFLAFAKSVGYRLNGIYDASYSDDRLHHFNALFIKTAA